MNSVFKGVAVLFVCVTAMAVSAPIAKAEKVDFPSFAEERCEATVPKERIEYKGLKQVALYISIPSSYEEALRCHGKEEECADQRSPAFRGDDKLRKAYIRDLISTYEQYPEALSRENLTKLFGAKIEQRIFPFVHRDRECQIPDIKIVTRENYQEVSQEKDIYLIHAETNVQLFTEPHVVLMQIWFYRQPEESSCSPCMSKPRRFLAIPLTMPADKIRQHVSDYINSMIPSDGNPLSK